MASEEDLGESDTIRDMGTNLDTVQDFGAKLGSEVGEGGAVISEKVDTMDASGGEPPAPLEEVFQADPGKDDSDRPLSLLLPAGPGYGRRPAGTPVPLVVICEDPAYCPPPPAYRSVLADLQGL